MFQACQSLMYIWTHAQDSRIALAQKHVKIKAIPKCPVPCCNKLWTLKLNRDNMCKPCHLCVLSPVKPNYWKAGSATPALALPLTMQTRNLHSL